ncbi:hypothetical protein LR48_Vigan10g180800 [Vigna angularis]|uniref:Uncharacterized protein n=1 Tax=Phaseolus angularis TaxID=3914 RepID=A0A0L9VLH9_PHAAN|nr:hypothetical protein LR48_Vigan10g180800 [Vigna angularis]
MLSSPKTFSFAPSTLPSPNLALLWPNFRNSPSPPPNFRNSSTATKTPSRTPREASRTPRASPPTAAPTSRSASPSPPAPSPPSPSRPGGPATRESPSPRVSISASLALALSTSSCVGSSPIRFSTEQTSNPRVPSSSAASSVSPWQNLRIHGSNRFFSCFSVLQLKRISDFLLLADVPRTAVHHEVNGFSSWYRLDYL